MKTLAPIAILLLAAPCLDAAEKKEVEAAVTRQIRGSFEITMGESDPGVIGVAVYFPLAYSLGKIPVIGNAGEPEKLIVPPVGLGQEIADEKKGVHWSGFIPASIYYDQVTKRYSAIVCFEVDPHTLKNTRLGHSSLVEVGDTQYYYDLNIQFAEHDKAGRNQIEAVIEIKNIKKVDNVPLYKLVRQ